MGIFEDMSADIPETTHVVWCERAMKTMRPIHRLGATSRASLGQVQRTLTFLPHNSQLGNRLIFQGTTRFKLKVRHWQDVPLVCRFCPPSPRTQTAPIIGVGSVWALS